MSTPSVEAIEAKSPESVTSRGAKQKTNHRTARGKGSSRHSTETGSAASATASYLQQQQHHVDNQLRFVDPHGIGRAPPAHATAHHPGGHPGAANGIGDGGSPMRQSSGGHGDGGGGPGGHAVAGEHMMSQGGLPFPPMRQVMDSKRSEDFASKLRLLDDEHEGGRDRDVDPPGADTDDDILPPQLSEPPLMEVPAPGARRNSDAAESSHGGTVPDLRVATAVPSPRQASTSVSPRAPAFDDHFPDTGALMLQRAPSSSPDTEAAFVWNGTFVLEEAIQAEADRRASNNEPPWTPEVKLSFPARQRGMHQDGVGFLRKGSRWVVSLPTCLEAVADVMVVSRIIPTEQAVKERCDVIEDVVETVRAALQCCVQGHFLLKYCVFGSVQLRTFLPDGDNDLVIFLYTGDKATGGAGNAAGGAAGSAAAMGSGVQQGKDAKSLSGCDYLVKAREQIDEFINGNVFVESLVFAEVKVLKLAVLSRPQPTRPGEPAPANAWGSAHETHDAVPGAGGAGGLTTRNGCVVNGQSVDVTMDQLGGFTTACYLHEFDGLVGRQHLFKESLLLLKAWALHEARILGGGGGYLGTYALTVLLMAAFNAMFSSVPAHQRSTIDPTPLAMLYNVCQYIGSFDFSEYAVTVFGPVPLADLDAFIDVLEARRRGVPPPPDADPVRRRFYQMQTEMFLDDAFMVRCLRMYSGAAANADAALQPTGAMFQRRAMNIMDPLRPRSNLPRGVSRSNCHRISTTFAEGALSLRRAVEHFHLSGGSMGVNSLAASVAHANNIPTRDYAPSESTDYLPHRTLEAVSQLPFSAYVAVLNDAVHAAAQAGDTTAVWRALPSEAQGLHACFRSALEAIRSQPLPAAPVVPDRGRMLGVELPRLQRLAAQVTTPPTREEILQSSAPPLDGRPGDASGGHAPSGPMMQYYPPGPNGAPLAAGPGVNMYGAPMPQQQIFLTPQYATGAAGGRGGTGRGGGQFAFAAPTGFFPASSAAYYMPQHNYAPAARGGHAGYPAGAQGGAAQHGRTPSGVAPTFPKLVHSAPYSGGQFGAGQFSGWQQQQMPPQQQQQPQPQQQQQQQQPAVQQQPQQQPQPQPQPTGGRGAGQATRGRLSRGGGVAPAVAPAPADHVQAEFDNPHDDAVGHGGSAHDASAHGGPQFLPSGGFVAPRRGAVPAAKTAQPRQAPTATGRGGGGKAGR